MANPIAVPGTNVPSGAAVSPGGAQGPSAVSANANNKATLGTDSLVLVQGTAAGVAATTHAQTVSGDDPQLSTLASASTKGLLNQTSGLATDFIDGTNNSQPLQPVIWSARLRSFNAVGNPNFEVDQRNVGNAVVNPGGGNFICDRWIKAGGGTYTVNCQQVASAANMVVPGTNFRLSSKYFIVTLTAQETTLGATEFLGIRQFLEGIRLRELIGDVHSVSLLVFSSVAGLKFSLAIRDAAATPTRSLVKLCTISVAGTWTLIPLPNLPVWDSGGTFNILPGLQGYDLAITLACGSTLIAPAADIWQSGNYLGAPGMSNFCASPVNSTFVAGFVQHEPGPLCTTPIDCPFTQNYDDCLRYYQKSYAYPIAVGGGGTTQNSFATFNSIVAVNASAFTLDGGVRFPKPMARGPTAVAYHPNTGTANQALLYYATSGTVPTTTFGQTISSVVATAGGIAALNCPSGTSTAPMTALAEWTADTGW
jgi:hypothetical protein